MVLCSLFSAFALSIFVLIKAIGVPPLAPVQNSVSLKLMQRKTLNFVINLPDVKNIIN